MSTIDNTATDKRDVYARVTAQIINAIEQGVGTGACPGTLRAAMPSRRSTLTSKKPYRGINTVCLWAAAQAKGYERGEWATYQQWQDTRRPSAQGREGHAGSVLEVRQRRRRESRRWGESPARAARGCCSLADTRVFNAAQVDGYTPKADADTPMPERIAHAEAFFQCNRRGSSARRKPSVLCSRVGPYPDAAVRRIR